jgi:hypothetical protein
MSQAGQPKLANARLRGLPASGPCRPSAGPGKRKRGLERSSAGPPGSRARGLDIVRNDGANSLTATSSRQKESLEGSLREARCDTRSVSMLPAADSGSESSSSTTSSFGHVAGRLERQRALQRRSKNRLKKFLASTVDDEVNRLSHLERSAITEASAKAYLTELRAFAIWAQVPTVSCIAPDDLDNRLAEYFDMLFLAGDGPSRGCKLWAALLHSQPEFSKLGGRGLPRGWRCLKGWTRLVPSRARTPEVWPVWAAVINFFVMKREASMAVYVTMMWSSYSRPGSLLRLCPENLIAPSLGGRHWTLLLNPLEGMRPSKTLEYDDSVALDHKMWVPLEPLLLALKQRPRGRPVWDFTYPALLRVWRQMTSELHLRLVPYQARHSGASHDRLSGFRSLADIKKRGCWRGDKSVQRYEKAARLGKSWEAHTPLFRVHAEACAQRFTELLLSLTAVA